VLLYLSPTAQVRQVIYKIIGRRRRAVIRGDPTFVDSNERHWTLPRTPGADGAGSATGNHRGSGRPVVAGSLLAREAEGGFYDRSNDQR
jgi:hypothetical protein